MFSHLLVMRTLLLKFYTLASSLSSVTVFLFITFFHNVIDTDFFRELDRKKLYTVLKLLALFLFFMHPPDAR